jgi:chaperonin GroEL (HSP60 family)
LKEPGGSALGDVQQSLSALINNASAVRAIAGAVEGTIGPKGLDTMLVDRSGDIVVTNAGVTILDRMDVSHPAARMLINVARAQHAQVGDGTTTATIMAGVLVSEGLDHVMKGVPVTRIIQGMKAGVRQSLEELQKNSVSLRFPDDPLIGRVALVAGRGDESVTGGVVQAARLLGLQRLLDPSFRMKEIIISLEGAEDEVLDGAVLKKRPVNDAMPGELKDPLILAMEDSLEPDRPAEGSLGTEAGFQMYLDREKEFDGDVRKLVAMGIRVILLSRGISEGMEQILTDAGVLVISRIPARQMARVCRHTGAVPVKKTGIKGDPSEIQKYLGRASLVKRDTLLGNFHFAGGGGEPTATFIIGAPTEEVAEEKERIAGDAASAVQAALRSGVVAGGGAAELAVSRSLLTCRARLKGMEAFGVDCVIEALKSPMSRIIQNAGFNPLQKVEEVLAAQAETGNAHLGIDCDTGQVADMVEAGVVDPALVKIHALRAASEVAQAILRIDTIIKMKE